MTCLLSLQFQYLFFHSCEIYKLYAITKIPLLTYTELYCHLLIFNFFSLIRYNVLKLLTHPEHTQFQTVRILTHCSAPRIADTETKKMGALSLVLFCLQLNCTEEEALYWGKSRKVCETHWIKF